MISTTTMPRDRYRAGLLVAFCIFWAASSYDSPHPLDLLLQHTLTVPVAVLLAVRGRMVSKLSFTLVLAFMCLHVVGARFLYSYVPYDAWTEKLFGISISEIFALERNHFDRFVHLAYGLLLTYPARELHARLLRLEGWKAWYVAVVWVMATSMSYELIEVGVAYVMSPETAERYNGQQGDIWDAQKDMALATAGALIVPLIAAVAGLVKRAKA